MSAFLEIDVFRVLNLDSFGMAVGKRIRNLESVGEEMSLTIPSYRGV